MAFILPSASLHSTMAQPAPVTEITLDQAVNMALSNNPSGKIAGFEFEAAKGTLTAARSYRWPTLSYNHKDSWTWHGEKYNDRYYSGDRNFIDDQFTNALTLNWTVWAGNKIESQVSQAKLALDSSQWGVAAARQTLKYNATDAFFKLMAARNSVKLSEESVERLEKYLQDVQVQFKVGVVAKVDMLRSEVSLAQAHQTLIEARNAYDLAMSNLNNIIGLPLTGLAAVSKRGSMTDLVGGLQFPTLPVPALGEAHEVLAFAMIGLLVVHVLAALKNRT